MFYKVRFLHQEFKSQKNNTETNPTEKLKFLELPPRIVMAPTLYLNHNLLLNVDGSDCLLYFKLISD